MALGSAWQLEAEAKTIFGSPLYRLSMSASLGTNPTIAYLPLRFAVEVSATDPHQIVCVDDVTYESMRGD